MHNGCMKEDEFSASAKRVWRNLVACLRQCGTLIVLLVILFASPAEAYAAPMGQAVKLVKTAGPLVKTAGPMMKKAGSLMNQPFMFVQLLQAKACSVHRGTMWQPAQR